jgi:carbamoyl-phosphate synthase small subunit
MNYDMNLVLEDGTELPGTGFGAPKTVAGEVVFNTAMAGYVETLTDPSYRGQILVCTYPLVGNYGVPAPRLADSIDLPFESGAVQVQGLVVQNYVADFSHNAAARSLGAWLKAEGVPGITGIDTRTLTRRLREHGTMRGWLFDSRMALAEARSAAASVDMQDEVFRKVAPDASHTYGEGEHTILLIDVGAKDNIVRSLLARGVRVIRAPYHADLAPLTDQADGILIGNGPGDPEDLDDLVKQLRDIMKTYAKPVMGICLGNQILARAAGASTFKLPYGHRSVNQPVQDLLTRRCFITSQNHGYAVDETTLPDGWEPWFVNINDGTNEGIHCRTKPFFSVQFHPEANPGPKDTGFLFDDFVRLVGAMSRGGS